jgi:hypothetical protein
MGFVKEKKAVAAGKARLHWGGQVAGPIAAEQ